MLIRTEIRFIIVTLFALQFATAAIGIWLVERTAPAIEMILAENDYSLAAAENMVHLFASVRPESWTPDHVSSFTDALDRAARNITEPEENRVIAEIRELVQRRFSRPGDTDHALTALKELVAINRKSMHRADVNAKRTAFAGGWTMVGFALLTLVFSLLMMRRSGFRLLAPIHRMVDVAKAYQSNDRFQRFEMSKIPYEFAVIGGTLNKLMDIAARPRQSQTATDSDQERAALNAVIELQSDPCFLFDPKGNLIACNAAGAPRTNEARRLHESGNQPKSVKDLNDGFQMVTLEQ